MSEQIEPLQRIDRLTPLEDVLARIVERREPGDPLQRFDFVGHVGL